MFLFDFGTIDTPPGIDQYGTDPSGLILFLNNILKIAIVAGVIFSLTNIVIAGIQYIGSSGNPETMKKASSRIWISLLGLVIIAGSISLAAVIGLIFFGQADAILKPAIFLEPK